MKALSKAVDAASVLSACQSGALPAVLRHSTTAGGEIIEFQLEDRASASATAAARHSDSGQSEPLARLVPVLWFRFYTSEELAAAQPAAAAAGSESDPSEALGSEGSEEDEPADDEEWDDMEGAASLEQEVDSMNLGNQEDEEEGLEGEDAGPAAPSQPAAAAAAGQPSTSGDQDPAGPGGSGSAPAAGQPSTSRDEQAAVPAGSSAARPFNRTRLSGLEIYARYRPLVCCGALER